MRPPHPRLRLPRRARGKPNYPGYWTTTTHLDGRRPGTDAIVVYFDEALGVFSGPGTAGS